MSFFNKIFGKKIKTEKSEVKNNIPQSVIEEQFNTIIDKIVNGEIKGLIEYDSNVMLKKDEHLILVIPNIRLCEERTVKYKGGSQSVSFRIMKGVSFRTGDFEVGSVKEMVVVDSGTLTLTNKRLSFNGTLKNNDSTLDKITSITPSYEGVIISRSGKQKNENYLGTNVIELTFTIVPDVGDAFEEGTVKYVLTGEEFKKIIEKLLNS